MPPRITPIITELSEAMNWDRQFATSLREGYGVYINSDSMEGRGTDTLSFATLDQKEAADWARGKGPMGSHATIRPQFFLVVSVPSDPPQLGKPLVPRFYIPLDRVVDTIPSMSAREKALAKLTPEEREALGLR